MKKFTALICAAAMTAGLLAGCSPGTSQTPAATDDPSAVQLAMQDMIDFLDGKIIQGSDIP